MGQGLEEGLRRPSRHRNHTHGVGEAGTRAPPGQHKDNVSLLEEASGLSWRKRRELVNEKLSQEGIHLGVQFSPVAHWCPTLCDPMNRNTPGLPVHHQLPSSLRLTSESVMPSSHLILCRPLLLLPPIPPSIRVFSNESSLRMRWPKYWSAPQLRKV